MNGAGRLVAGLALLGACASAPAGTWVRGVAIEALQGHALGAFTVFPVGAPVMGCNSFKFKEGQAELSARGEKHLYAMALTAFALGKRLDIFFDETTEKCFSRSLLWDTLQQQ